MDKPQQSLERLLATEVLDPEVEQARKVDGNRVEEKLVEALRGNADNATALQAAFLVKIGQMMEDGVVDHRDLPHILRATSDAQAKAVDAFMKLTGRSAGAPESDTMQLIRSLANDGLLKMNIDIEVGKE